MNGNVPKTGSGQGKMSMAWADGAASPGSDEALAKGCTCPVLDNGHGKRPPYPPDDWWMTLGCPQHDIEEEETSP